VFTLGLIVGVSPVRDSQAMIKPGTHNSGCRRAPKGLSPGPGVRTELPTTRERVKHQPEREEKEKGCRERKKERKKEKEEMEGRTRTEDEARPVVIQ